MFSIVVLSTSAKVTQKHIDDVVAALAGLDVSLHAVTWKRVDLSRVAGHFVVSPAGRRGAPRRPSLISRTAAKAGRLRTKAERKIRRTGIGRAAFALIEGGVSRRFWRAVRTQPQLRAVLNDADAIIVLDPDAIRAGWHVARRHRDVVACIGAAAVAVQLRGRALA